MVLQPYEEFVPLIEVASSDIGDFMKQQQP